MNYKEIEEWLSPIVNCKPSIRLECDGLSRVISMLFQKEGIKHNVMVGSFCLNHNNEEYKIKTHFWIDMLNEYVCDFRIRMWLDKLDLYTPNGIFIPNDDQIYTVESPIYVPVHPIIFNALTDCIFEDYPPLRR